MSNSSSGKMPTKMPPAAKQTETADTDIKTPLENISMASVKSLSASATAVPSKTPPAGATAHATVSNAVATIWSSAATIDALWSINQDKNSWVGVAGIGWKKLSNASDSGIVALTMLSSHAKQLSSVVYYREEDDGMIHEIYAW